RPFLQRSCSARPPTGHDGFVCMVHGRRRACLGKGRERSVRVGETSGRKRTCQSRVRARVFHGDGHWLPPRPSGSKHVVCESGGSRGRQSKATAGHHKSGGVWRFRRPNVQGETEEQGVTGRRRKGGQRGAFQAL
ncbi:hypothetical protein B0A49_13737, partial [Cryomyces minteri]